MKNIILFFTFLILSSCKNSTVETYNTTDFNWTIEIPNEFEKVSNRDWDEKVEEGGKKIEETNNVAFENQSAPIFCFKNNSDYFEATKNRFEGSKTEYINYLNEINDIQNNTLKSQIPDSKVKSTVDTVKIDKLDFIHRFTIIEYPNKAIRYVDSFDYLFNNGNELTINITYLRKLNGEKLKKSLFNSKFSLK